MDQDNMDSNKWDHDCDDNFFDYYKKQSTSQATIHRFRKIFELVSKLYENPPGKKLTIADIGGGAGACGLVWAHAGHDVITLDINQRLIELGRQRAKEANIDNLHFDVASATDLPLANKSLDICLVPELLEHVNEWEQCLDEFTRVLKPNGLLFLTTTNSLCPMQDEFNLPFYSWYPQRVKRHFEKLSITTKPHYANYATYPAINWFTFYSLRQALQSRDFKQFYDGYDLASRDDKGSLKNTLLRIITSHPITRFFAQFCSNGTTIIAIKQ